MIMAGLQGGSKCGKFDELEDGELPPSPSVHWECEPLSDSDFPEPVKKRPRYDKFSAEKKVSSTNSLRGLSKLNKENTHCRVSVKIGITKPRFDVHKTKQCSNVEKSSAIRNKLPTSKSIVVPAKRKASPVTFNRNVQNNCNKSAKRSSKVSKNVASPSKLFNGYRDIKAYGSVNLKVKVPIHNNGSRCDDFSSWPSVVVPSLKNKASSKELETNIYVVNECDMIAAKPVPKLDIKKEKLSLHARDIVPKIHQVPFNSAQYTPVSFKKESFKSELSAKDRETKPHVVNQNDLVTANAIPKWNINNRKLNRLAQYLFKELNQGSVSSAQYPEVSFKKESLDIAQSPKELETQINIKSESVITDTISSLDSNEKLSLLTQKIFQKLSQLQVNGAQNSAVDFKKEPLYFEPSSKNLGTKSNVVNEIDIVTGNAIPSVDINNDQLNLLTQKIFQKLNELPVDSEKNSTMDFKRKPFYTEPSSKSLETKTNAVNEIDVVTASDIKNGQLSLLTQKIFQKLNQVPVHSALNSAAGYKKEFPEPSYQEMETKTDILDQSDVFTTNTLDIKDEFLSLLSPNIDQVPVHSAINSAAGYKKEFPEPSYQVMETKTDAVDQSDVFTTNSLGIKDENLSLLSQKIDEVPVLSAQYSAVCYKEGPFYVESSFEELETKANVAIQNNIVTTNTIPTLDIRDENLSPLPQIIFPKCSQMLGHSSQNPEVSDKKDLLTTNICAAIPKLPVTAAQKSFGYEQTSKLDQKVVESIVAKDTSPRLLDYSLQDKVVDPQEPTDNHEFDTGVVNLTEPDFQPSTVEGAVNLPVANIDCAVALSSHSIPVPDPNYYYSLPHLSNLIYIYPDENSMEGKDEVTCVSGMPKVEIGFEVENSTDNNKPNDGERWDCKSLLDMDISSDDDLKLCAETEKRESLPSDASTDVGKSPSDSIQIELCAETEKRESLPSDASTDVGKSPSDSIELSTQTKNCENLTVSLYDTELIINTGNDKRHSISSDVTEKTDSKRLLFSSNVTEFGTKTENEATLVVPLDDTELGDGSNRGKSLSISSDDAELSPKTDNESGLSISSNVTEVSTKTENGESLSISSYDTELSANNDNIPSNVTELGANSENNKSYSIRPNAIEVDLKTESVKISSGVTELDAKTENTKSPSTSSDDVELSANTGNNKRYSIRPNAIEVVLKTESVNISSGVTELDAKTENAKSRSTSSDDVELSANTGNNKSYSIRPNAIEVDLKTERAKISSGVTELDVKTENTKSRSTSSDDVELSANSGNNKRYSIRPNAIEVDLKTESAKMSSGVTELDAKTDNTKSRSTSSNDVELGANTGNRKSHPTSNKADPRKYRPISSGTKSCAKTENGKSRIGFAPKRIRWRLIPIDFELKPVPASTIRASLGLRTDIVEIKKTNHLKYGGKFKIKSKTSSENKTLPCPNETPNPSNTADSRSNFTENPCVLVEPSNSVERNMKAKLGIVTSIGGNTKRVIDDTAKINVVRTVTNNVNIPYNSNLVSVMKLEMQNTKHSVAPVSISPFLPDSTLQAKYIDHHFKSESIPVVVEQEKTSHLSNSSGLSHFKDIDVSLHAECSTKVALPTQKPTCTIIKANSDKENQIKKMALPTNKTSCTVVKANSDKQCLTTKMALPTSKSSCTIVKGNNDKDSPMTEMALPTNKSSCTIVKANNDKDSLMKKMTILPNKSSCTIVKGNNDKDSLQTKMALPTNKSSCTIVKANSDKDSLTTKMALPTNKLSCTTVKANNDKDRLTRKKVVQNKLPGSRDPPNPGREYPLAVTAKPKYQLIDLPFFDNDIAKLTKPHSKNKIKDNLLPSSPKSACKSPNIIQLTESPKTSNAKICIAPSPEISLVKFSNEAIVKQTSTIPESVIHPAISSTRQLFVKLKRLDDAYLSKLGLKVPPKSISFNKKFAKIVKKTDNKNPVKASSSPTTPSTDRKMKHKQKIKNNNLPNATSKTLHNDALNTAANTKPNVVDKKSKVPSNTSRPTICDKRTLTKEKETLVLNPQMVVAISSCAGNQPSSINSPAKSQEGNTDLCGKVPIIKKVLNPQMVAAKSPCPGNQPSSITSPARSQEENTDRCGKVPIIKKVLNPQMVVAKSPYAGNQPSSINSPTKSQEENTDRCGNVPIIKKVLNPQIVVAKSPCAGIQPSSINSPARSQEENTDPCGKVPIIKKVLNPQMVLGKSPCAGKQPSSINYPAESQEENTDRCGKVPIIKKVLPDTSSKNLRNDFLSPTVDNNSKVPSNISKISDKKPCRGKNETLAFNPLSRTPVASSLTSDIGQRSINSSVCSDIQELSINNLGKIPKIKKVLSDTTTHLLSDIPKVMVKNVDVASKLMTNVVEMISTISTTNPIQATLTDSNIAQNVEKVTDRPNSAVTQRSEKVFISSDPQENCDNNNPKWAELRDVSSDAERYRAVRRRWRNLGIPDPNKNLTFRHRRIVESTRQKLNATPIITSSKRISCTFLYDKMIEEAIDERKKIVTNLRNEQKVAESLLQQRQKLQLQQLWLLNNNNYSYNYSFDAQMEQMNGNFARECDDLKIYHHHQRSNASNEISQVIERYKACRDEVKTFQDYYHGLDVSRTDDTTILTERQTLLLQETERMYTCMENIYSR